MELGDGKDAPLNQSSIHLQWLNNLDRLKQG
jgi:hypothetical protein